MTAAASLVLIVDDQPIGREALEELLYGQGYTLDFAADGHEALAKAAAQTPDVILLDVMMPGMDGFEVCRRLRADPHLSEVPVIMLTALDDQQSRLAGIEAGADDFLTKPFNRAELRARIRTVTRLNRYRRLVEERSQAAWVIDHADDGYVRINADDELLYANPLARTFLGLDEHEADLPAEKFLTLARRQYVCQPEDNWAGWPNLSALAQLGGRYLVRPESPSAEAFWLQVEMLQLPGAGTAARLLRLRDVTAQLSARQEWRTFQAVANHKLRTPLVPIITGLSLLADRAAQLSGDEMADLAAQALRGGQRLQGAIEDILQFARPPVVASAGQGFALAQLPLLADRLKSDLKIESLTSVVPDGLAAGRLTLAPQTMEIILGELLENARKFHPTESPTVQISASPAARDGGAARVSLRIRDDGLSLSPEQLAQAWTPYYQGEKDFTGNVPGMGLGLPLVANLIWSVGGACRIFNRPDGPGVVVELNLPLAE